MKKIIAALVAVAAVLLVGPASPAAAATGTCTNFGTFRGTTAFTRSGPNNNTITFNWATAEFVTSGTGLEYRVRWYAISGALIWDSGYSTTGGRSATVFPGVNRVMGVGSSVDIDAGQTLDGHATCAIWLGVN